MLFAGGLVLADQRQRLRRLARADVQIAQARRQPRVGRLRGARLLQQRDRLRHAVGLRVLRRQHRQCRLGAWVLVQQRGQQLLRLQRLALHRRDARQVDLRRNEIRVLLQHLAELRGRAVGVELRQLQQSIEVLHHRRVALRGAHLLDGIGRLVQVAGRQRGEEQCLADLRCCGGKLQRAFEIDDRRLRLARAHARARKARLQPDIVRCQRFGLLEGLHRILAAAGRGIGPAEQVVGFRIALAGLADPGQRFRGEIRAAFGELQPRQHLVARKVIRRARRCSAGSPPRPAPPGQAAP